MMMRDLNGGISRSRIGVTDPDPRLDFTDFPLSLLVFNRMMNIMMVMVMVMIDGDGDGSVVVDGGDGDGDGDGENLAKDPAPLLSRLPRLLGVGVLYLQSYLPSSSTLTWSWSWSRSSAS